MPSVTSDRQPPYERTIVAKEPDPHHAPDRPMTTVERVIAGEPEQVWEVLSDGWLYPVWVVGATHMRDVDDNWPDEGAQLHHQVGAWPLMISDTTQVAACEPTRRLALQARAWPMGAARIEITIEAHRGGTLVRMAEAPARGIAYRLDNPLLRKILIARNTECLVRLAAIVENRHPVVSRRLASESH
jgi:uncharacterized protein YndB with AHSA1/START domain